MDSYIIVGIVVLTLFVAIMTPVFTKLVLYKKKLVGRYFYGEEITARIDGRLGRMTVDMSAGDNCLPLERREQI